MIVGKRVCYSGQVQGVGFRYTAQHLAAGYPVAGHVRNLPMGDVELVVEGEADVVDRFLAAVAARMAAHIVRTTVADETPSGRQGFHIRH
jgi:acylphosphatase